ncbi:MAG TPA: hypothetical protein ENK07_01560 [Bacteroidetes bacterium]|nr:hypothetical protein [Bacteroidota bacterium]
MTKKPDNPERSARRRRWIVGLVLLAAFLSLALLNLSSWLFLRHMGRYFQRDLAAHLTSVASLSSRLLEAEYYPTPESLQDDVQRSLVRAALLRLQVENDLQAVYLIDRDYRVVLASRPELLEGELLGYLVEDSSAIRQAWQGVPAASTLHVIAGNRFLSAFAPVGLAPSGPAFVLAVEANAAFFDILRVFRRGLVVGSAVSLALLLLFGATLTWSIRALLRAEESLRRRERLAAMGQMAATVAHEIRNPLGIIKGTADVLKQRYGRGQADELFDYIPEEVERLNRLITDFLLLSREPDLKLETVDLGALVERVVKLAEHESAGPVECAVEENLPPVACDPAAVERVLLNLLRNAREACGAEGKVSVAVELESGGRERAVCVAVRDTGPGFPGGEEGKRVFEPFFTTKPTGTGLGLAVAETLVRAHGGRVEARNLPGGGAEVRFCLPV